MKKMICTFFLILFLPAYVLAYSKLIIPGGESIGININLGGLLVVGHYKVNNEYINNNINISDKIIKINDKRINNLNDFISYLNKVDTDNINITIIRNNKEQNKNLKIIKSNGEINTGLYVKDNVVGIGTLTFIDPVSKKYASLGHPIMLNETKEIVSVKDGNIFESIITNITKSRNGYVGSKKANIIYNKNLGTIIDNLENGLYGYYTSKMPNKDLLEVATFDEIKNGEAYILTVTDKNEVSKYKINIIEKYYKRKDTAKAFGFEVVDEKLLSNTGGIVQGMSGSPIIQNNKIIGAVTNVLVDDVTLGYGISIITMLEQTDNM